MNPAATLPAVLAIAWLLPLAAFAVVWIGYSLPQLAGRRPGATAQRFAGWLATSAIGSSFALSMFALVVWLAYHPLGGDEHGGHGAPPSYSGDYYLLAQFGELRLSIGYYIDALTVAMFAMVTLISTCVHVYSMGYMDEELHEVADHEVATSDGNYLHRPGRYHRFYQYLSLFSFSMLGIVLAGNLAMVFVFWELVGICSYFLIGFYYERPSASTAANKAFIVNRIGDFGMLIGLMALWTSLGTLQFGDTQLTARTSAGHVKMVVPIEQGIFSKLRSEDQHYHLDASAMVRSAETDESAHPGYWLLFVAGLGIFSGCVGKSAQFPLHTWLPDAMAGPTPVSALVHSATMVAAGVYLVGRCYPIFVPEALLVVAVVGAVTLALGASIAITAFDIKHVLAYSTISQLGYMMLALGLGGWVAGLFHLVTHAFFKSLLFLCSGSVIHAVHSNDLRHMGGLRHKMPWTAYTMLAGCLAIIGAGVPIWGIGFSGYFSKDAVIEQAWSFAGANPSPTYQLLLYVPIAGAFATACYMFRLWYMTFVGEPGHPHRFENAHESPPSMVGPLVVLAVFAIGVGWHTPFMSDLSVTSILEQARPAGTQATTSGTLLTELTLPDEHLSHEPEIADPASQSAFFAALLGVLLATMIYVWRWLHADEIRQSFAPIYKLLSNAWWFNELYQWTFVRPTLALSRLFASIDRWVIDPLVNGLARLFAYAAKLLDRVVDRGVVDSSFDALAHGTWDVGLALRRLQTGRLRQYMVFLVVGTLGLFAIASLCWKYALAG